MMQITVNGRVLDVAEGDTLLHALEDSGIAVPSLCDDRRLAPFGECRMCLVHVAGRPQLVPSCATAVEPGMVIETAGEDLEATRSGLLGMLARHYPDAAVRESPDEPLHRLFAQYDVVASGAGDTTRRDESHPCISVDMSRCIDCFRCVRICEEVQGQFAWQIEGRGPETRVVPAGGGTLLESPCVGCGACVDTCPTGALEDRGVVEFGSPTGWTRTTCPYCGVGCELMVGTRDNQIVTAVPAADAPVNKGHACVKGRYGHGFVHSSDRVTSPMVRDADGWRAVSWDEAAATVAAALTSTIARTGPDSVGVLGSARATNEDNYVLQKFARVVLGTNNVDCCARVCHAPSAAALRSVFGTGAATNSFDDIEAAETILVCGCNPTENHPVVGARIKQAARRGAALIVIDPRRIELADYADIHLAPRPGTNILLLNAIAATIIEEGLVDEMFVRDRVDGLEELTRVVEHYRPEEVAERCGVDPNDIRAAARLYATRGPAMAFHGLGVTEHTQGTDGVTCLANLALLTGNVGRVGAGVNPLRGQNNVQGAAHMGCEPDFLPGFVPVTDAARHEAVWGAPVPSSPGLDLMEMLEAAAAGTLRALWAVGWDIRQTQPNMTATDAALANLDLLIVQDLFMNETASHHAHVFLPACSTLEKHGTFMNGERRVQRVRAVVDPLGESKPDFEIVCRIAREMGSRAGFEYARADDVWDELRRVWPQGAGISAARLDAPGGVQWPCPTEDHPGTTVLHTETFAALGPRTSLRPIEYLPTPERADGDYPFVLVTGRVLDQFNAGTMTRRSLTRNLHETDVLEIAPSDADAIGLVDGARVQLESHYGVATLPVRRTDRVEPGQLFTTFSDPETAINRVTGPHRDPITHTPEYKVTAVRLVAR